MQHILATASPASGELGLAIFGIVMIFFAGIGVVATARTLFKAALSLLHARQPDGYSASRDDAHGRPVGCEPGPAGSPQVRMMQPREAAHANRMNP